jgi:hypothetical protein
MFLTALKTAVKEINNPKKMRESKEYYKHD